MTGLQKKSLTHKCSVKDFANRPNVLANFMDLCNDMGDQPHVCIVVTGEMKRRAINRRNDFFEWLWTNSWANSRGGRSSERLSAFVRSET